MPRLGYWIGRPFWGRGYGTEAVALLVDHAFERHAGRHVGAGVFDDNPASRRVLEKLGFAGPGATRSTASHAAARCRDVDMQLTRAAWEEGRR